MRETTDRIRNRPSPLPGSPKKASARGWREKRGGSRRWNAALWRLPERRVLTIVHNYERGAVPNKKHYSPEVQWERADGWWWQGYRLRACLSSFFIPALFELVLVSARFCAITVSNEFENYIRVIGNVVRGWESKEVIFFYFPFYFGIIGLLLFRIESTRDFSCIALQIELKVVEFLMGEKLFFFFFWIFN